MTEFIDLSLYKEANIFCPVSLYDIIITVLYIPKYILGNFLSFITSLSKNCVGDT